MGDENSNFLPEAARCAACGAPKGRGGRKRIDTPVKLIIATFKRTRNVRATARIVGLGHGLVWWRLKAAGLVGTVTHKEKAG